MAKISVSGGSTNRGEITVKPSDSSRSVDTVNNAAFIYSELAKKWAISEELVENTDYSSKHYAGVAKEYAEEVEAAVDEAIENAEQASESASSALESASTAQMYATQASTGMLWLELHEENWVAYDSVYEYELPSLQAVAGVYEGVWENKTLVNANVKITDSATFIYCLEPIDGYVLCTDAVVTPSVNEAITEIVPVGNIDATRDGKTVTLTTKTYEHTQGVASDVWRIEHNLNKNPSITIVDSANNIVEGRVVYIDKNTVDVEFNCAFKGTAYLN